MPFYERQPYIQPLHQIISEVMRGDIRCPRFQRPGAHLTWKPWQRGDLLDSLYRGFPIGTILLWSTTKPIATMEVVGGFRVPSLRDPAGTRRLLLDGHQRLSTLVQILGPGLVHDLEREGVPIAPAGEEELAVPAERWVFDLDPPDGAAASREQFVLLKPDQEPTGTMVPLDIVLSRSALNRWIRDHNLTDAQSSAVDSLRDRLREYAMPVAVLAADSIEQATESFKRINSSGTPMSDFHMVAALAFTEHFDLLQQFAEARADHLEPIGWGAVSDTDLLRVCAGLVKINPARLEVEGLATRFREDPGLVKRAFEAVGSAAKVLIGCGVLGPESLPYTWQLITLAVYAGRQGITQVDPSTGSAMQRWFWISTYGEVFSGINAAVFDRGLRALDEMVAGKSWGAMARDLTRQVRPVDGFDFRTARSKACAFTMARLQDHPHRDGEAHRALATGVDSMQLLFTRGRRSRWWHLAIVTPRLGLSQLRDALRRLERGAPEPEDSEALRSLGLRTEDAGSVEDLLRMRRQRLVSMEQKFVAELGLDWAPAG